MKQEIDPKETNRKEAFGHWMKSPMPMVTLTKTFDVTRLYKLSKQKGWKFNMLLCWCIAKTASKMEEFYLLPENGKLYNLEEFNANYQYLTQTCSQTCQDMLDGEAVIVGTSALVGTELDSIVNQYSGIFNNPFMAWGRYRKGWFKTTLPISFQFHHVQMDGQQATHFLEELQKVINII